MPQSMCPTDQCALRTILSNCLILSQCHQWYHLLQGTLWNPQCNLNLCSFNQNHQMPTRCKGLASSLLYLQQWFSKDCMHPWGSFHRYTKSSPSQLHICAKLDLNHRLKCRSRWESPIFSMNSDIKEICRYFPGGAVAKNPPASAGDMGSSPGPGRSHMPRSN